jgi:sulfate transport system permease protein
MSADSIPHRGITRSIPPARRVGAGKLLRAALVLMAVAFLTLFVVIPAANVFYQAFSKGKAAYRDVFFPPPIDQAKASQLQARLADIEKLPLLQRRKLSDERRNLQRELSELSAPHERARKNWSAVRMTLGVTAVVLPLNVLFGIAAAWSITKFRFKGRSLLVSVIDLPFSVSPVIAGLIFVLLFGAQGALSAWSKWTGATSLAPAVYALRWLPLILLAAWLAARFVPRRNVAAIAWTLAILAIVALIIKSCAGGSHQSWSWLAPGEWKWPDPTTLHWRGFSSQHWWPLAFREHHVGVIFTPLATVLASAFVTFPFVARSLIPLMEAQGPEAEQAALTLGAGGWYTFRRVTLPSIKWGLLYGAILCTARAMGEFGAVSVVSGHLDSNDTMPLRIEKLWQEYKTQAAFSVASLLACLAIVTLIVKSAIEWKTRSEREEDTVTA